MKINRVWPWPGCCSLGLVIFAAAFGLVAQDAIRITEFMAVNRAILADEDGDFPDWVEIHNGGMAPRIWEGGI